MIGGGKHGPHPEPQKSGIKCPAHYPDCSSFPNPFKVSRSNSSVLTLRRPLRDLFSDPCVSSFLLPK